MNGPRRTADAALVACFVAAIVLPLADHILDLDSTEARVEQRELAPRPTWEGWGQLESLPRGWENHLNDHFGWRDAMIRAHGRLKVQGLHTSSAPSVLVGQHDWLFLRGVDDQFALDSYRRFDRFTDHELQRWQRMLEARQRACEERGAQFLFVLVPNKHTVYPEHMPPHIARAVGLSRADQLVDHLRSHSEVSLLDLRPVLTAAKAEGLVYRRTGSHWNPRGKQIAATALVEATLTWFPLLEPTPLRRYRRAEEVIEGGDLARLLGLQDVLRESEMVYTLRPPEIFRRGRGEHFRRADVQASVYTGPQKRAPQAMLVGDSFGGGWAPFLAPSFARVVFVWHRFDPELIAAEGSHLVINQVAERFLMVDLPEDPGVPDFYPAGTWLDDGLEPDD